MADVLANVTAETMFHRGLIKKVSLEETIQSAIRIVRASLALASNLTFREPTTPLPKIPSYAGSLRRAWINLLENAVVATEGKGEIKTEVRREGDAAVVRITDSGPGLPHEALNIVSGHESGADQLHPDSLGLRITKQIVTEHGGSIRVVRTSSTGTVLDVMLPFKGAPL
jgi:signal transduction histidine kinase